MTEFKIIQYHTLLCCINTVECLFLIQIPVAAHEQPIHITLLTVIKASKRQPLKSI